MATFRKNPHVDDEPFSADTPRGKIVAKVGNDGSDTDSDQPAFFEPEESANTEPLLTEIDHVAIAVRTMSRNRMVYAEGSLKPRRADAGWASAVETLISVAPLLGT